MGIIKAAMSSIGGALADQWLETIEPSKMDNTVLASPGVMVRRDDKRNTNTKGTSDIVSNGSIIHVPENTFMLLVDGGKIISATDEAGYYQVDNSRSPSLFFKSTEAIALTGYGNTGKGNIERPGGLVNTLVDSWERFKHGGSTPTKQRVFYINKMEIPDIRFGTKNPVSYADRALIPGRVVACKVTSFGTYSIKIADPLLFYTEVCSKSGYEDLTVDTMAEQYINEFIMAYSTALANLSTRSIMVQEIQMHQSELGQYMAEVLDSDWLLKRGFLIHSVGIAGMNFDDKTNELLEKYSNDSLLLDGNARAARMTAGMAAGLEAAGSNANGAMFGFAGMTMGMNAAAGMGVMPSQQQTAPQPPATPAPQPQSLPGWSCACGNSNGQQSKFCSNCGVAKPAQPANWFCPECGTQMTTGQFCSNCGTKRP